MIPFSHNIDIRKLNMSFYYALTIVFFNCVMNTNCYSEPNINEIVTFDTNKNSEHYPRVIPPKLGWVDPFDMLGDNKGTSDLFTLDDVHRNQLKFRAELCNTHLLKFVNLLRRAIESHNPTDSVNLVKLEFMITEKQLNILKEFGKGGSNGPRLETVSDVLNQLFTQTDYGGGSKNMSKHKLLQWLQNAFVKIINSPEWTVVVSVSVMLLGTLWFFYKTHSYHLALFSVFLTIFFAGFGFTWMRMYEEKEAESFLDSVMYGGSVPYHCTGQELLWYEQVYYRMFGADCLQFYKTRNVRPIVKISPTEVFAETLSMMFINPATNIGKSYGNFIDSVSSAVPSWLIPIASVFAFIIPPGVFLILLIFFFRYQITFSITGLHIMPSWGQKSYNEVSRQSSQYVEDISRKEDERYQKNSFTQALSDNTNPLFLVNWLGLKKLITDVKVTDENEVELLTDTENHNNTISDDAKSKDVKDEELEGFSLSVKKQISKIRSRGILTIGERSSSVTKENDELVDPAVSQASGDHSGSVTICDKKIQSKEKRT